MLLSTRHGFRWSVLESRRGCVFAPARLTDIGPIASNMREMDRVEAVALGRSPKEALRSGLRCSYEAFTATDDEDRPQAMMGVVPLSMISGRGAVWMLGTEAIYDHGRDLLSYGPFFISHWLETFRRLENIVAVENLKAIRLLRHWGFIVGESVEMHRGVAFLPFHIERTAIQATALAA
jgi:hypothetical protein